MKGIDASFSRISRDQFRQFKAAGYEIFVQALWTGGYASNDKVRDVANANLRDAQTEGLTIAGYINASPWRSLDVWILEAQTNAGDMWPDLTVIAVDFEIEGTPDASVKALCEALEAANRKVCVYTARWYWERSGSPAWASLGRWPLWVAQYDGLPAGGSLFGPFTKLIGKQYAGSTQMFGAEVDLDEFDPEFWRPLTEKGAAMTTQGEIDKIQSEQIMALQTDVETLKVKVASLERDALRRGAIVKLDGDVRVA